MCIKFRLIALVITCNPFAPMRDAGPSVYSMISVCKQKRENVEHFETYDHIVTYFSINNLADNRKHYYLMIG